jgi:hypothetical protein
MRMLLNRRQVKLYTLEQAGHRAHRFTRVSQDFYGKCEAHLRQFIANYVHRLPSKGKTII